MRYMGLRHSQSENCKAQNESSRENAKNGGGEAAWEAP